MRWEGGGGLWNVSSSIVELNQVKSSIICV